jgi:(R,R)-butanediol dehydrogenase/meso-butanediol dehydrogenase/diacetyl reductase
MKAARFYGQRDIRVEDVTLPPLKENEVGIEIAWCGICGSDKHRYEHSPNRGQQVPFTMGHEFSGVVREIGSKVKGIKAGDRVVVNPLIVCHACYACRHGYPNLCRNIVLYGCGPAPDGAFAEYTQVPDYTVIKIPDSLPLDKAAVVEPSGIAFRALRISRFKPGDDAAVFGAGPIGLLMINELKAAGANRIYSIAHTASRRELAKKFGATKVLDPDTDDVVKIIMEETGAGVSVSYDFAGADQTLAMGLAVLHAKGEVIMGALPMRPLALNVFALVHGEQTIKGSQCTNDEFPIVAQMISDGKIFVDDVITKKICLDDIVKEGFETLIADKSHLKILVTPHKKYLD